MQNPTLMKIKPTLIFTRAALDFTTAALVCTRVGINKIRVGQVFVIVIVFVNLLFLFFYPLDSCYPWF